MQKATLLEQAKRIKDVVVRKQAIDNVVKYQHSYNNSFTYFLLSSLFSWANTPEKYDYWDRLDTLYGKIDLGKSNEYVAAYPINDDKDIPKTPKITDDIWINCKTVAEAKALFEEFDKAGLRWANGAKYVGVNNYWDRYEEKMCYNPSKGSFMDLDFLNDKSEIYPASLFINQTSVSDIPKTPKITDDIWIHCKTEAEAKALLEEFHKAGLRWSNGDSYVDKYNWSFCRDKTVYNPSRGVYNNLDYVTSIYPASLFINQTSVSDIPKTPKITDDIWIHCETEAEAKVLLEELHKAGLKWCTGGSYVDDYKWSTYKEKTIYNPSRGTFSNTDWLMDRPTEKSKLYYPASFFINQSNQSFINNSIQTYGKHTDGGTAAYIRPENGSISVAERRVGIAVCYRGCKILTRTGHSPNGAPAYGI